MSYVRMNYLEYVSEEAADELEAQYVQNAPINFPDATALVFLRTGPTTASLTSVILIRPLLKNLLLSARKASLVLQTKSKMFAQKKGKRL